MDTIAGITSFVCAAEVASFAEAGRRLAISSAAVGQNVARLEAHLGVRLFQRTTRSLALTEAGERFLIEVRDGLGSIQLALANTSCAVKGPSGTLKVSMGVGLAREYVLPALPKFLKKYPALVPDWHFENRPVDLIAEGFDAAIGGGIDLRPGLIARVLAPAHRVLLASPDYLSTAPPMTSPRDQARHPGILIKSPQTGRVRPWILSNALNHQAPITLQTSMTMSDPDAACQAAALGLGVTLVSLITALPYLESGQLVRLLPEWYVDGGNLSVYFAERKLLPAKTRVFIEFLADEFARRDLSRRLSGKLSTAENTRSSDAHIAP
jgi:DNA-binding transcriptional LysR family regulator